MDILIKKKKTFSEMFFFYATEFPFFLHYLIFHSLGTRLIRDTDELDWGQRRKQRSIYHFTRRPFAAIQLRGPGLEFKSLGQVQECDLISPTSHRCWSSIFRSFISTLGCCVSEI